MTATEGVRQRLAELREVLAQTERWSPAWMQAWLAEAHLSGELARLKAGLTSCGCDLCRESRATTQTCPGVTKVKGDTGETTRCLTLGQAIRTPPTGAWVSGNRWGAGPRIWPGGQPHDHQAAALGETEGVKVAIYCRVSTESQDTDNQLLVLRQAAVGRGLEVVAVYQEAESAWRGGHQRELARLLRDARLGRFEVVLAWSLDRLSREGPLAILTIVHRLGRYGVKVLSYQEPWTEAPRELAEILYAIAGWIARMESQRLSERTKAGLARACCPGPLPWSAPGVKGQKEAQKTGGQRAILGGDGTLPGRERVTMGPFFQIGPI